MALGNSQRFGGIRAAVTRIAPFAACVNLTSVVMRWVPKRLFAIFACAVWVAPTRASACAGGFCGPNQVAPATGVTVPANAPALVVVSRDGTGTGGSLAAGLLLEDASGVRVPLTPASGASPDPNVFAFGTPLVEGQTYRLSIPATSCDGTLQGPSETTFETGPPVALPSSIGAAAATASHIEQRDIFTQSGSCTAPATIAVTTITVTPTPELDAYLGVTNVSMTVDGVGNGGMYYGTGAPGKPVQLELTTTCHSNDKAISPGIGTGTHHVSISATIAGAMTEPPPLELDVTLDCSESSSGCALAPRRPARGNPASVAWAAAVTLLVSALGRRARARSR